MHLTVLSDMEDLVFFVIGDLTRHDGFGLKVSEIPPFVGKKLSSFTVWNTMCIVNNLGIL